MPTPTGFSNPRRGRRGVDPSNRPGPPDVIPTLEVTADKLRITVPFQIAVNGIPQIGLSGGAHVGTEMPTSVTPSGVNSVDLGYAHIADADDACHIPSRDPGIRGPQGQYLAAALTVLA